jgi:hypothetical protein
LLPVPGAPFDELQHVLDVVNLLFEARLSIDAVVLGVLPDMDLLDVFGEQIDDLLVVDF